MRRHTIAGLMLTVLACALAVAALRYASELWVTVVLATTLALLGCSIFGVAYRTGARRAGWLGFLVFGGGYVALAFTPWGAELKTNLPVTRLLVRLDEAMHPDPSVGDLLVVSRFRASASSGIRLAIDGSPTFERTLGDPVNASWSALARQYVGPSGRREHFLAVGHGLCALLSGLIGAIIARRFHRTNREAA
jgi:hypothetical protein